MTDSIWHSEAELRSPEPRWVGAVPVAIVGGGIAGVAVGYWLARDHGIEASIYERGRLAEGASGRAAGFLLIGPADYYDAAVERWGRDLARSIWRFSAENRALLSERMATI